MHSQQQPRQKCSNKMVACLIHYHGISGNLVNFSRVSFLKCIDSRIKWILLDGPSEQVAKESCKIVDDSKAKEILQATDEDFEKLSVGLNLQYHRACYSRFTDVSKIARAEKRKEKKDVSASSSSSMQIDVCENLPRKTLRSALPKSDVASKSPHVLPAICIICNEKNSYYTNQVNLVSTSITYNYNLKIDSGLHIHPK